MTFSRRRPAKHIDSPEEAQRLAMEQALLLLKFRARSRAEMSQRLARKGFDKAAADQTVARLIEVGLIDDAALAQSLIRSRRGAHQGDHRIRRELRKRGIAQDTAAEAIAEAPAENEGERVWEALMKRAPRLSRLAPETARRRLEGYLFRQGFEADDVRSALRRYFSKDPESADPGEVL